MNSNLVRYQAARFLSTIGMQMISVAVGWQVYALTKRPLDLGLIGLVQFFPIFFLAPFSGQAADRYNRTGIIMACLATNAFAAVSLMMLSWMHILNTPSIFSLLFLIGIAHAFWGPAAQSLLPQIVPTEDFPRAVAMNSTVWQVAVIIGPALGGAIYGIFGKPDAVYTASLISLALALAFLATVHVRFEKREHPEISAAMLTAGVRYVWKERIILGAISLDLFAVLLGGATALLPAYASDVLHVGPTGLGILRSAPGLGAAVMGILLALRPMRRNAGTKMLACVLGFGIFTIVFGLSRNFMLSLISLVLMGAFDLVSVVVRMSLVQLRTPDEMRGRVSAVNHVFIGASNELGEFESGITAALFGLVPAVVIGGIGTCLVTFVWAYLFPEFRSLDQLSHHSKAA